MTVSAVPSAAPAAAGGPAGTSEQLRPGGGPLAGAAFARDLRRALQGSGAAGGSPAGGGWTPAPVGELGPEALPAGPEALRWAAGWLEGQLWSLWLEQALGSSGGGPFGGGFAGSVYHDWLARALADQLVQAGPSPLAEALVEQLSSPPGG